MGIVRNPSQGRTLTRFIVNPFMGCEVNPAGTSVTLLIAGFDSADLSPDFRKSELEFQIINK